MENKKLASSYTLRILRGHPGEQYWEEFLLPRRASENIISALMAIQKRPITKDGKKVTPVAWESGCLEEVCGSCSMLINGIPKQSCSAIVDILTQETGNDVISLAPLSKFPLVRDLIVDRSVMFENLKKVHAWVEVDDCKDHGFGPKISPEKQEIMYALSRCFSCGCCSESCPQINKNSKFIGPAAIAQAYLFDTHPVGKINASKRLHVLMGEGGVGDCGNAQNCVAVCPRKLPLTDAIAAIGRDATMQAIKDLFSSPERN